MGKKDDHRLVPKSKGAGVMLSDEKYVYLCLTGEGYESAKFRYPELVQQNARALFEHGESKEG